MSGPVAVHDIIHSRPVRIVQDHKTRLANATALRRVGRSHVEIGFGWTEGRTLTVLTTIRMRKEHVAPLVAELTNS